MTPPADAAAIRNSREALIGQWNLVSLTAEQDGRSFRPFGENPVGILIFDGEGRYATQVMRADLPKFSGQNRMRGTPEENHAIVAGCIAYHGTYALRAPGVIDMHITACSYPNFNGVDQTRTFVIEGDEMRYHNPTTSFGAVATLIWKRAGGATA